VTVAIEQQNFKLNLFYFISKFILQDIFFGILILNMGKNYTVLNLNYKIHLLNIYFKLFIY